MHYRSIHLSAFKKKTWKKLISWLASISLVHHDVVPPFFLSQLAASCTSPFKLLHFPVETVLQTSMRAWVGGCERMHEFEKGRNLS